MRRSNRIMKLLTVLVFVIALVFLRIDMNMSAQEQNQEIKMVSTPPDSGSNDFYQGNRSPLLPNPLIKLPIRTVQPGGWIRHQLELMAEGFTGHLTEISKWCTYENNAWVSPDGRGEHGWEEVPYWLRGFIEIGYILDNKRIINEAERWVEGVISTQREDGYFGPRANWESAQISHTTAHDIWPTMVMLYVLRSYYDATGDERIINLMKNYFHWLSTVPLEYFLTGTWQHWRGGDNLNSIYWLYNQTGGEWLLDLAIINHDQTANWAEGIPTWHGVNLSQAFREPAQFYQQIHAIQYLNATERNFHAFMDEYGQVPGGMFGADENAREGYVGPRQAAESCSMVEFMHSDEMLVSITGDIRWADHCETVAFNSLPAAMSPDLRGLHYLTAPNMVQLDKKDKSPMLQNGGNMLSYNPWRYRCCQHNVSFGWPYFAERLWMATRDNGIAAVFYGQSSVTAKVGSGVQVSIQEETDYPFDEVIRFKISPQRSHLFPIYFRIPRWAKGANLKINGKPVDIQAAPSSWLLVKRTWKPGDVVQLTLPMTLNVTVWEKNKHSVSVNRGPLTYSLKIGERWVKYGGTDEWPAYEVYPTTPWNYGLIVDKDNSAETIEMVKKDEELADQPFSVENAPIELRCKAKRIPEWTLEDNGLIGEIPKSPIASQQKTESVTLIPMGCARLRVSAFPMIQ